MLRNFLRRDEFLHVFSKNLPVHVDDTEFDVSDKEIACDVALLTMDSMSRFGGEGVSWATRLGDSLRSFELDEFFAGLDALYAKICYGDSREMAASEAREVERLA